jgi:hypothetical protein
VTRIIRVVTGNETNGIWGGNTVHVDKDEIVGLLRSRGEHDKASIVGCALPRRVDTEADAGLLSQYDLSAGEIAAATGTGTRDGLGRG